MKNVLFLYFTQTEQTRRALSELASGFDKSVNVEWREIRLKQSFSFPWSMRNFFRAFPKCHPLRVEPTSTEEFTDDSFANLDFENYDLIVFGYQSWFLTPSIPVQKFLRTKIAQGLKGKSVLTVLTCRNLWYATTRKMQKALGDLGADHRGQITICETNPAWATFVTTPRWMLTGNKSAFWFFPAAGIREEDFLKLKVSGTRIQKRLLQSPIRLSHWETNWDSLSLRIMDGVGSLYFKLASNIINRIIPSETVALDIALFFFRVGLITVILTVLPIGLIAECIHALFVRLKILNKYKYISEGI